MTAGSDFSRPIDALAGVAGSITRHARVRVLECPGSADTVG
jgi:hypothetical protein